MTIPSILNVKVLWAWSGGHWWNRGHVSRGVHAGIAFFTSRGRFPSLAGATKGVVLCLNPWMVFSGMIRRHAVNSFLLRFQTRIPQTRGHRKRASGG